MIELTVTDMTCRQCASAIARAVADVDAGGKYEIDLATRRVRIASAEPPDDFIDAIREAGYTALRVVRKAAA